MDGKIGRGIHKEKDLHKKGHKEGSCNEKFVLEKGIFRKVTSWPFCFITRISQSYGRPLTGYCGVLDWMPGKHRLQIKNAFDGIGTTVLKMIDDE